MDHDKNNDVDSDCNDNDYIDFNEKITKHDENAIVTANSLKPWQTKAITSMSLFVDRSDRNLTFGILMALVRTDKWSNCTVTLV